MMKKNLSHSYMHQKLVSILCTFRCQMANMKILLIFLFRSSFFRPIANKQLQNLQKSVFLNKLRYPKQRFKTKITLHYYLCEYRFFLAPARQSIYQSSKRERETLILLLHAGPIVLMVIEVLLYGLVL